MQIEAIRIRSVGGPEMMRLETIDLPEPGPGQVHVRHKAIGINFIDTYHRTGLYKLPLPSGLGMEAAGVIEALGAGVSDFKIGERVAYGSGPVGAYATASNVPAANLAKLPDEVSFEQAATMMLKGLTSHYLLHAAYVLKRGETILFHAAAGGVGLIVGQWARHLGVTAIGTVGSEEKAQIARANGYAHVLNYRTENVPERVRELTGSAKLPVVYDGVGKDTFEMSLDCLAPRGLLVSFGNASGPVTGVDLGILAAKGSLYLTRTTMAHYLATPEEFRLRAKELFAAVAQGAIRLQVGQRYALKDAAEAHRALESRETIGASILIP
jgi:NADPH2:quinone reductase